MLLKHSRNENRDIKKLTFDEFICIIRCLCSDSKCSVSSCSCSHSTTSRVSSKICSCSESGTTTNEWISTCFHRDFVSCSVCSSLIDTDTFISTRRCEDYCIDSGEFDDLIEIGNCSRGCKTSQVKSRRLREDGRVFQIRHKSLGKEDGDIIDNHPITLEYFAEHESFKKASERQLHRSWAYWNI